DEFSILADLVSNPGDVSLTAVLVQNAVHGSLTLNADGTFVYTPTTGFVGSDSFQYAAFDGQVYSNVATITMQVRDSPPQTQDLFFTVHANATLSADSPGLLANASEPADNGDQQIPLPLVAQVVSPPSHGTLSAIADDGSFTYTPAANFAGTDSLTYQATDGIFSSNVSMVTIEVTDSPPDTEPATYHVPANGSLSNNVLVNDFSPDGETLSTILVSPPADAASFQLNTDGSFSYTPNSGFIGQDGFSYQASDGIVASGTTSVTLNVTNQSFGADQRGALDQGSAPQPELVAGDVTLTSTAFA